MSKALVIKNADFSGNKVAVISFDNVPCTGITLNTNTLEISSLSETGTLTATLTPENTTDSLVWTTSNNNVATVENGIVTPVWLGTATITATCGNQTATAQVDVALIAHPQWEYKAAGPSSIDDNTAVTYSSTGSYPNKYITAFGTGSEATEHYVASTDSDTVSSPYSIKVPAGTSKVKISATSMSAFYIGSGGRFLWSKDIASGQSGNVNAIKAIQRDNIDCSQLPIEMNVPSGADSFILTLRFTDSQEGTANSVAENCGIKIEFLTAT